MDNIAYSYHTFMLPFTWDCKKITLDDFVKKMTEEEMGWEDYSFKDLNKPEGIVDLKEDYQYSNMIQYFTESARQSAFGWGKDYVNCLSYKYKECHDKWTYYIKKTEEKINSLGIKCQEKKSYRLEINAIKIKIYNTGIAILIFETENKWHKSIKDVKNINEYGRRIFAPYFSDKLKCDAAADELGIEEICELQQITGFTTKEEKECIPNFVIEILPKGIDIKPAIDDRMYVCCCVTDPKYSDYVKEYKKDIKVAESFYEFIFVDREGNCSCQSGEMLEKLLRESVYGRWENYGTFTAVSHHSMMFLSNGGFTPGIESFLTQYTQMAAMVLAQRAAIIAFDSRVSDLSEDFEKPGTNLNEEKIKKLSGLQEQYIAFLNQHMNIEVTCQEQGIEVYEMLQKQSYIREENDRLEREIKLLGEAAQTATENSYAQWAFVLSIVAIIISALGEMMPLTISFIKWIYCIIAN